MFLTDSCLCLIALYGLKTALVTSRSALTMTTCLDSYLEGYKHSF